MEEEDWAKFAIFTWLSAYMLFFVGSCFLLHKKATVPRWLIFIGTLFLSLVNIAMLVVYSDTIDLRYNPIYEDPSWGTYMDADPYPAWQRYFYWGTALLDILGKTLAGIGLIAEGRQQVAILRYRTMQRFQGQPNSPN